MLDFSCSVYGFGRSVGAHGQGETLSFQVNVQYPYLYHIADLYRFKRVLDKSVAYLGDVNETVTVVMINYYMAEVTKVKDGENTVRVLSNATKTSPIDERTIATNGFAVDEYVVITVDVDGWVCL